MAKITPAQKAWEEELKQLKKAVTAAEKKGRTFTSDYIPERPARITKKRLAELKVLTQEAKRPTIAKIKQAKPSTTGKKTSGGTVSGKRSTVSGVTGGGAHGKSKNRKAWDKQVARLKRLKTRAEKRGYQFSGDFIPKTPKIVTKKALENISKKKGLIAYEDSIWVNPDTGEAMPGTERRKQERSEAAQKAAETRKRKKERGPETPESPESPETPEQPQEPERPGAPDDTEGHFHVIEQIIQKFGGIPAVKYGGRYQNLIDLETGKQMCVDLLLDEWDERTERGEGAAYAGYLRAIESQLAHEIDEIIYHDSDQSTVDGHYTYIASLIKAANLTMEDFQEIESAYDGAEEEEYY